ncbi:MAG: hypothetical protein R3B95_08045 [Nitrospirales bacterium]|nr:hypothetical protein [Nitrospirales bacterium]
MTNRKRQSRTRKPSDKQPPGLIAWHVAERGEKSFWTRIGAAWDHEDAKGMTLQLELMPVGNGRIVLREPSADTEDEGEGA